MILKNNVNAGERRNDREPNHAGGGRRTVGPTPKSGSAREADPARSVPDCWQRSVQADDWLLASILHDLRNPVATILTAAEMLKGLDLAPSQTRQLAVNINKAAFHVQSL